MVCGECGAGVELGFVVEHEVDFHALVQVEIEGVVEARVDCKG